MTSPYTGDLVLIVFCVGVLLGMLVGHYTKD